MKPLFRFSWLVYLFTSKYHFVYGFSKSFEIRDGFLGFDQTDRKDAETLLSLVKRCLLQLGLDFENIRGQTYDGAENMRGQHNGLHAKILALNRKALFTYCVDIN